MNKGLIDFWNFYWKISEILLYVKILVAWYSFRYNNVLHELKYKPIRNNSSRQEGKNKLFNTCTKLLLPKLYSIKIYD